MKKNKYLVFAMVGFELISLLLLSLWAGQKLIEKGYSSTAQAFCVLLAFFAWFVSLILKLKKINKND